MKSFKSRRCGATKTALSFIKRAIPPAFFWVAHSPKHQQTRNFGSKSKSALQMVCLPRVRRPTDFDPGKTRAKR
jgi:hypothetical protein